jgi:tetratricopeptide (TPR) repeat protein
MKTAYNYFLKDKKGLSDFLVSLLVASVTFVVFAQALHAEFLNWDDYRLIVKNPKLGILNLLSMWSILNNTYLSSDSYTPLAGLRFCIIFTLSGLKPFAYHLASVLFHIANTVLLFVLVRKLVLLSLGKQQDIKIPHTRLSFVAALAALIWSLNPLMAESTSWIAIGPHAQAVFFMLLSLLSYIRANETEANSVRWLTLSIIFYGASILSQLIALAFPAILMVLDVYPLKRISITWDWLKSLKARRVIFEKIPFIFIALTITAVDIILLNKIHIGHHVASLAEFGLLDRIMQAFYVYAYYLWRPWYPVDLSPVYLTLLSFNPLSYPFMASAFIVIGCTIVILLLRHRYPAIAAAWFCYLIILLPVLGLNLHPHFTSDHYAMCVSMIWSVLLAGWILTVRKSLFRYLTVVIISITILFSVMTYKQIGIWHDTIKLCQYMLEKTTEEPKSPIRWKIYQCLATYYLENGRAEESINPLTEAIRIDPENAYAHRILGILLFEQGREKEAFAHINEAIRINPSNIDAYNNFAELLRHNNRNEEAMEVCKTALEISPNNAETHAILGAILVHQGRISEAIDQLTKAIKINPDLPEAHFILGTIFTAQGKYKEATDNLSIAIRSRPDIFLAYYYLGLIAEAQGRYDEAVQHFQDTLNLRPDFEKARIDLRNVMNLQRKTP